MSRLSDLPWNDCLAPKYFCCRHVLYQKHLCYVPLYISKLKACVGFIYLGANQQYFGNPVAEISHPTHLSSPDLEYMYIVIVIVIVIMIIIIMM